MMIRRLMIGGAALACAAGAQATPNRSQITRTADGTIWYLEDSSVKPADRIRPGLLQFWLKSENPPGQAIRQWGVRIYLDCGTRQYMKSFVLGSDANGKVVQSYTVPVTPDAWTAQDPMGVIAPVARKICPKR